MASIKKPSIFELTALSVNPTKGLKVEWSQTIEKDVEKNYEQFGKKSDVIPHQDMNVALSELKSYVCKYYGWPKEKEECLEITKLSVNYYENKEQRSVQIYAKHLAVFGPSRQKTPIKTAKITLHESTYGFEDNLSKVVDEINSEACLYVFERKSAQPEMMFSQKDEEAA